MENKTWLSYWKKSLSDAQAADIDIDKFRHFEIENFNLETPVIEQIDSVNELIDFEETRINKKRGISNKNNNDWISLDFITVLIAPFKLVPVSERQIFLRDKKPKFPFWFYAKLDRVGNLAVPEETFPVFQRKFLEPLADEKTEFIFTSVENVDNATVPGKEKYDSYSEYLQYLNNVFALAVGKPIAVYSTDHLATINNAIVLLPDEDINAAFAIIQLYEKLLKAKDLPPLLNNFIQLHNNIKNEPLTVEELIDFNSLHLGQMGFEFPLSISQRKSLYTFLQSNDKVFAVNGPPGTGKTTLLQSIVANMVVEHALKGIHPPFILACSTNNQAVTNILDSFIKAKTAQGSLEGRWLPEITGYATYLPSNTKTANELKGINYKKLNGDGLFTKVENHTYLSQAKEFFLKSGNHHFQTEVLDIPEILRRIQKQIGAISSSIVKGGEKWKSYQQALKTFDSSYCQENLDRKKYFDSHETLDETNFEAEIAALIALEKEVVTYFREEPFFRKLFCFLGLKSALKSRTTELRVLLRNSLIQDSGEFIFKKSVILDKIDSKINEARSILKGIKEWKSWKQENNIKGNPPRNETAYWEKEYLKIEGLRRNDPEKSQANCFYDELDITLRHQAFQLALHYWEGRWILKLEEDLFSDNFAGRNDEKSRNRWQRQAMLTPCFVSTFYMAPRFFTSSRFLQKSDKGDSIFDNPPLTEFIDLLIVDEAGQVSPEIGIPTFSLARKAAIVGDIQQIEPVYNITNKMDIGNLKATGLVRDYDDLIFEKEYHPKGFLASTGSIMKMAQNACSYQEKGLAERGVLLIEHRRCFDEIISYCNMLAYGGLLKPLKGSGIGKTLFPPMYCIHVEAHSTTINNSRYNQPEADAIIGWLLKNKDVIEEKYNKKIEDVVGIITPFVGQKQTIYRALNAAGFDTARIKLGTVHALQGAERPIIIFSTVYGPGDAGTMFFDRDNKPNMLNVAVSRAQDNFIVFANSSILNKETRTPSGILAGYLTYERG
ncbi:AAA domain-containing protein [Pseudobacter ginsenosidimutans]|uniref:AAA domain-containing protein n=1 Tax=Pseudobacter ginsenosidimutans TaxID=661488 RepID=A0A4Q7N545_9BACT|nr:AAA domain-containing protein [Pseudobacter ginsenosidimutans]QEC44692.1 AAA family ATPase [Pseudobacter ginsenosidimutans]RZS76173.1 AAA domain-containing protein [Pseudobacter ginsenosidimutans]